MKKRLICLLLALGLSVSAGGMSTLAAQPVVKIPISSGGVRDEADRRVRR